MGELRHAEVCLVRAPMDKVWDTVSKLDVDYVLDGDIAVKGKGKGATRTIQNGKTERTEKVVEMAEKDRIVFEIEDGKANGRLEVQLEEHELGTMLVHRATLDVSGMGKGRYKKELRNRLDGIRDAIENE